MTRLENRAISRSKMKYDGKMAVLVGGADFLGVNEARTAESGYRCVKFAILFLPDERRGHMDPTRDERVSPRQSDSLWIGG